MKPATSYWLRASFIFVERGDIGAREKFPVKVYGVLFVNDKTRHLNLAIQTPWIF